jgi:hypothetical protein
MKTTRVLLLFAGVSIGLLALTLSRAQTSSHMLKLIDPSTGKEFHTLMGDQRNALVAHLETAGQTNAIEMFRQYRCAYGADLSSSELGETVAILRSLHEGRTNVAIQRLEQHLERYVSIMCNSYGGLNATNRERVNLEPLEETRKYYTEFPPSESSAALDNAMDEVLRSKEKAGK